MKDFCERILQEENSKHTKPIFKYVAFENMTAKQWEIYDSTVQRFFEPIPFGRITIDFLNTCEAYNPDNPNYQREIANAEYLGLNMDDIKSLGENVQCCQKLNKIYDFLFYFKKIKLTHAKSQYMSAVMDIWKEFREMTAFDAWKDVVPETMEALHQSFLNNFLVYIDNVYWERSEVYGRLFCTSRPILDIFYWDLYHVLTGTAPMPNVCERCKALYASNNPKARYCDVCKEQSNVIRNERRKANDCRYLHKHLLDRLRNRGMAIESEAFRTESNYYWAIIKGEEPEDTPLNYDSSIKTEEQYLEWLKSVNMNIWQGKGFR